MSDHASFRIKINDTLNLHVSERGKCNRLADLILGYHNPYSFELTSVLTQDEIDYINLETFHMCDGEFEGKEKEKDPSLLIPIIDKITTAITVDSQNYFNSEDVDWIRSRYRECLFDLHYLGELHMIFKIADKLKENIEIFIWFE